MSGQEPSKTSGLDKQPLSWCHASSARHVSPRATYLLSCCLSLPSFKLPHHSLSVKVLLREDGSRASGPELSDHPCGGSAAELHRAGYKSGASPSRFKVRKRVRVAGNAGSRIFLFDFAYIHGIRISVSPSFSVPRKSTCQTEYGSTKQHTTNQIGMSIINNLALT